MPIVRPPAAAAPRDAARITPPSPPVTTVTPARASSWPASSAHSSRRCASGPLGSPSPITATCGGRRGASGSLMRRTRAGDDGTTQPRRTKGFVARRPATKVAAEEGHVGHGNRSFRDRRHQQVADGAAGTVACPRQRDVRVKAVRVVEAGSGLHAMGEVAQLPVVIVHSVPEYPGEAAEREGAEPAGGDAEWREVAHGLAHRARSSGIASGGVEPRKARVRCQLAESTQRQPASALGSARNDSTEAARAARRPSGRQTARKQRQGVAASAMEVTSWCRFAAGGRRPGAPARPGIGSAEPPPAGRQA